MERADRRAHTNETYWKTYAPWFGERAIRETAAALRVDAYDLAGETALADRFEPEGEAKGTVLSVHGVTGCARQSAPVHHAVSREGWRAVAFDLLGFGWDAGRRAPWTAREQASRIARAVLAVRERFGGPVYVSGASLGATLAYHAAAAMAVRGEKPPEGLALYAIADLASPEARRALSRWGPLTALGARAATLAGALAPRARVPLRLLASDAGAHGDAALLAHVLADPGIPASLPLGSVRSILADPPPVPFERFTQAPTLVFAPEGDRTIPNALTRDVYDRLACPKRWAWMPGADHWRPTEAGVGEHLAPQLRFFEDLREGRFP